MSVANGSTSLDSFPNVVNTFVQSPHYKVSSHNSPYALLASGLAVVCKLLALAAIFFNFVVEPSPLLLIAAIGLTITAITFYAISNRSEDLSFSGIARFFLLGAVRPPTYQIKGSLPPSTGLRRNYSDTNMRQIL